MGEELICHFGKHEGERLGEIPTGYLRWCVDNITDPRPTPKYQKHDDGTPMTLEEVNELEKKMATFIAAAKVELEERDSG